MLEWMKNFFKNDEIDYLDQQFDQLEQSIIKQREIKDEAIALLAEIYDWTFYKDTEWAIRTKKLLDRYK